jgi:hypothetical protein
VYLFADCTFCSQFRSWEGSSDAGGAVTVDVYFAREERAYSELVEMPLTECVGRCKTGRLRPIPVHFVQVLSTRTFIPSQTIEGSRSSMSFYGVHDTGGNRWQNTEGSSGTSRGRPDYVNCADIPSTQADYTTSNVPNTFSFERLMCSHCHSISRDKQVR